MSLKRSLDLSPTDWIQQGKAPIKENDHTGSWPGVCVTNCLPEGFSAYCKIFHPIYVEEEVCGEFEKNRRESWRELAQRYGLEFHSEISAESFRRIFEAQKWPGYLSGPDEGYLDDDTCRGLVDMLRPLTKTKKCWFYYSGFSIHPCDARLYYGELEDVLRLHEQDGLQALPEYWWPDDRAWCVNTDWDLTFTLVAGPSEIAQHCSQNPFLEILPVDRSTRVDDFADVRNARLHLRQVAELVLNDGMDLSAAAAAMNGLLEVVGREFETALATFAELDLRIRYLPAGTVRTEWNLDALKEQDERRIHFEEVNRPSILKACHEILARLGT